jgi:aspartate/methionine/tyrosine aminotransferase
MDGSGSESTLVLPQPGPLAEVCHRLQEMSICCVNIAAQAGALAALQGRSSRWPT